MRKFIAFLPVCFFYGFSQTQHVCSLTHLNSVNHHPVVAQSHVDLENQYNVKYHVLDIQVERTNKDIAGFVQTVAEVVVPVLDTFAFELHSQLTIDSVVFNGISETVIRNLHEVRVPLSSSIMLGSHFSAFIYYHGTTPNTSGSAIGNGFNNGTSQTWGNQVTWSLSEPYSAYEWWPCKQQLRDKIDSVKISITTDSLNKAGSNGLLTSISFPGNGKAKYDWMEKHFIDYYLVSVTVAKYVEYNVYAHPTGMTDSILVQNYVYDNPATLPNFKANLDLVPSFIELFSDLFGLYAFADEKYGHCMAPFGGGMEHQTMTSIGFFSDDIDAHELGHQWWGDNVTCGTWNDIFINEGFASYCEFLRRQYLVSQSNAIQHMNQAHFSVMSANDGSVWCPDTTDVGRIFDSRLSYDKGETFIHELRFLLNDDTVFFNALKSFQQLYGNATATGMDLKQVLENESGMNLTQAFDQWYFGEGFPTFTVKWNQIGSTFLMTSDQTVSFSSVTPLYITDMEYTIKRSAPYGDTTVRVAHGQANEFYTFSVAGTVTSVVIDPNQWVVNAGTATKDANLVGISELDKMNDFRIYPQPSTDLLFVENQRTATAYEITDLAGKVLSSGKITGFKTAVSIDAFPSGMYTIRLKQNDGYSAGARKFVKQ
jgi:aminopeptidase N